MVAPFSTCPFVVVVVVERCFQNKMERKNFANAIFSIILILEIWSIDAIDHWPMHKTGNDRICRKAICIIPYFRIIERRRYNIVEAYKFFSWNKANIMIGWNQLRSLYGTAGAREVCDDVLRWKPAKRIILENSDQCIAWRKISNSSKKNHTTIIVAGNFNEIVIRSLLMMHCR